MLGPIFADDSSAADKRTTALNEMMEMCPASMRPMVRPMLVMAMQNAPDEQIASLSSDLRRVRTCAADDDFNGIVAIARKYGATDEMINAYLPLFTGGSVGSGGSSAINYSR
jgi:hypothetical protein